MLTVIDFWYSGYIFISKYIGPTVAFSLPHNLEEACHIPTALVFIWLSDALIELYIISVYES